MLPRNLRYSETHEWVKREGDTAVVGITDQAGRKFKLKNSVYDKLPQVTSISFCEEEEVGISVERKQELGTIETTDDYCDLMAPVSGEIIDINKALKGDALGLVDKDPYGKGWLIKLKMHDSREWDDLLSREEYQAEVGESGRWGQRNNALFHFYTKTTHHIFAALLSLVKPVKPAMKRLLLSVEVRSGILSGLKELRLR